MKKEFCAALIAAMIIPATVFAEMKELVKDLEAFPRFVNSDYQRSIDSYFLQRRTDFVNTAAFLTAEARKSIARYFELKMEWELLASNVAVHPENAQSYSVDMLRIQDRLEMQKARVSWLRKELESLGEQWKDRCSEATLKFPAEFYNPRAMYPYSLDQLSAMKPTAPNVYVEARMPVGSDASGGAMPGHDYQYSASGEDGMIMGGSVAAGAIIGGVVAGVFSGAVAAPAGAKLGMYIGMAVGTVIVSVKNLIVGAARMDEYHDLIDEAHRKMYSAIETVAQEREKRLKERCNEVLIESEALKIGEIASSSVGVLDKSVLPSFDATIAEVRSEYAELLPRYLFSLEQLKATYFKKLTSQYFGKVRELEARLAEADIKAEEMLEKDIAPVLDHLKNAPDAPTKAFNEQRLWITMIVGDAIVQGHKKEFFQKNRLPTFWDQVLDLTKKQAVQQ